MTAMILNFNSVGDNHSQGKYTRETAEPFCIRVLSEHNHSLNELSLSGLTMVHVKVNMITL